MRLPRLHVVTDDDVLGDAAFEDRARALIDAHGAALALHLRAHGIPVDRLHRVAAALDGPASDAGAPVVVVNDRVDVALATGHGVQLGHRSIPVQAARRLVGPGCPIGYSAHGSEEAASAAENGADYVVIGTIWPTASHPDRPGAGVDLVRETVDRAGVPVIAIGGVDPERVGEALAAGAHGVAVLSGVWSHADPVAAAAGYLAALDA